MSDWHVTPQHRADAEEIRAKVDELLAAGDDDPEHTHIETDGLYVRVLRAVADRHPFAVTLANEVLRLAEREGRRWYA